MSDIPQGLLDAAPAEWVIRVLAALRPEDAHLVPAMLEKWHEARESMQAEIERYRTMCNELSKVAAEQGIEVKRLKAQLAADESPHDERGDPHRG